MTAHNRFPCFSSNFGYRLTSSILCNYILNKKKPKQFFVNSQNTFHFGERKGIHGRFVSFISLTTFLLSKQPNLNHLEQACASISDAALCHVHILCSALFCVRKAFLALLERSDITMGSGKHNICGGLYVSFV